MRRVAASSSSSVAAYSSSSAAVSSSSFHAYNKRMIIQHKSITYLLQSPSSLSSSSPKFPLTRFISSSSPLSSSASDSAKTSKFSKPDCSKFDLKQILSDLHMSDMLGLLEKEKVTISDMYDFNQGEFRALVPEMGPRNRLKAKLRELAGGQQLISDVQAQASVDAAAEASKPAPAAADNTASNPAAEVHLDNLRMPKFFEDMTEGKLVKWHVKLGEAFGRGTPLCDIETDLAVVTFDAQDPGHISEFQALPGAVVKPMDLLAVQVLVEKK